MALKLAVLKDGKPSETRCAATPETIKKYVGLGLQVEVEKGLGEQAGFPDQDYAENGATLVEAKAIGKDADLILSVNAPADKTLANFKKNAVLLAVLDPHNRQDAVASYAKAGIQAMAMELMPRITRAQSMDVLSSQSNLAG